MLSRKFFVVTIALVLLTTANLGISAASVFAAPMRSARWVLAVTNSGGEDEGLLPGALYSVDTLTDALYGPFLEGQLGTAGGGLFDIAVTPDCRTALVSNFGDGFVFIVDVSNPTNLQLLGSVNITFFAEDIAITPNGRFAIVTDGGFTSRLASVDIAARTLVEVEVVNDTYHNAVAVAPDGTVITADYFEGNISTFVVDGLGYLTHVNTYSIPLVFKNSLNFTERPVNVAVAPDGQTVLLASTSGDYVTVYRKTGLGTLTFVGRVSGLPPIWNSTAEQWWGGQQSITFSADGTKAYVISNGLYDPSTDIWRNNQISVLDINGPGSVSLNTAGAATLLYNSSSQLFGVDCMDVANNKLYIGNPTISNGVNYLHVVDLNDFSVSTIPVGALEDAIVAGVATIHAGVITVGGEVLSVDRLTLLLPLMVSALAAATIGGAVLLRKRIPTF